MPLISKWPWLEERLLALGAAGMSFNLDAGTNPQPFSLNHAEGLISIATPICFEDTVPSACRNLIWRNGRKAADVIVNASNDGWFGSFDCVRRMHLEVARFRAIENRVPLLRAANTGISAHVDSSGRVIARTEPRISTSLLATPQLDERRTVFATIGQLPVIMLSIAALFGLISTIERTMPTDPGEQA